MMPPRITVPVQASGGLLAKLGERLKRAHAQHKNDETKVPVGMANLPAGLTGIAQLSACKFDKHKEGDNAGKYFFYAAGIIQEPETFTDKAGNVHRTRGKRTSITCPFYDTPGRTRQTLEEHLAWIYNEFRKLGVNTSSFPADIGEGFLEGVAALLVKQGPYFEFEVSQLPPSKDPRYKDREPGVYQAWLGKTEYETNTDPASGVVEAIPSLNGSAHLVEAAPAVTEITPEPEPDPISPEDLDNSDITSLLYRAKNGEGADCERAQNQLVAMAVEAGHEEATVKAAQTWEEVVEMIGNPLTTEAAGEGEDVATEEVADEPAPTPPPPPPTAVAAKPTKGKKYTFRPLGADKKTRVKKAVDCECTTVEEATKTCTLRSLVDGKTLYKNVKWDVLNK